MINILAAVGLLSILIFFGVSVLIVLLWLLGPEKERKKRAVAHRPGEEGWIYEDD
jgi:hypothetical protein